MHYHSYCSDRLNPNLYEDGKVCVSLLGTWSGKGTETWTLNSNLLQLLVSIQGSLLLPLFLTDHSTMQMDQFRPSYPYWIGLKLDKFVNFCYFQRSHGPSNKIILCKFGSKQFYFEAVKSKLVWILLKGSICFISYLLDHTGGPHKLFIWPSKPKVLVTYLVSFINLCKTCPFLWQLSMKKVYRQPWDLSCVPMFLRNLDAKWDPIVDV